MPTCVFGKFKTKIRIDKHKCQNPCLSIMTVMARGKALSLYIHMKRSGFVYLFTHFVSLLKGDRVILGGDHYFRFNHPAEVQSGKRASCWNAGDGQRDFEFAKNELLSAQRAQ